MKKNYTGFLFAFLMVLLLGSSGLQAQTTITMWDFDAEVLTPTTGSGTAENVGGTTSAFAGGNPGTGRGWNTSTYPEQSIGSGTAGAQFTVSTAGYNGIAVSWDNRNSNTAANRLRVQYTIDGSNWLNFEATADNATNALLDGTAVGFDNGRFISQPGVVWFNRVAEFQSIAGVDNNPNFAVRMVTEFATADSYVASTEGSTYGTSGTIRYDNVTFMGGSGTAPLLVASPSALTGFTYLIGEGPSDIQTTSITGGNLTPGAGTILATASASYEVSGDGTTFGTSVSMPYNGGTLSATTVHVRLKAGLAAGNYSEILTISGGGAGSLSISLTGTVSSGLEPALTNVLLPQYMEGTVPNPTRVPYAWLATVTNLLPNTTYRYYNRVVLATDGSTYTGAGNIIYANQDGTFSRVTSPSLSTAGAYGEFTTNASGSYSGWFITEPTGNASRFEPGTLLHMRILLNDGANGGIEATYLTTEETVKVLGFGTAASDTAGTAIRGVSDFAEKSFVFLYSNTTGAGRPIYGTMVETTGVDFAAAGNYAPFYLTDVAGQAGAWGGIVPNVNPNGIMRVEERSLAGGILAQHTSASGMWGGIDTRNPTGGVEGVLVINTIVGINEIPAAHGKVYTYSNQLSVEFQKDTRAEISVISLQGSVHASFNMNNSKMLFNLEVPAGIYLVKVTTPSGIFSQKVLVK